MQAPEPESDARPAATRPGVRMLLLTADRFPPFRPDVEVLFAQQIGTMGNRIDWIMQSDTPRRRAGTERLGDATVWVGARTAGSSALSKAWRIIQGTLHDISAVRRAPADGYDLVQVKDKFAGAIVGLLGARRRGVRFVYWLSFPFPEAWLYTARTGAANHPLVNWIRGHLFGALLYRVILPRADLVFVQSEQMKADLVAKGLDGQRMRPVPMGVADSLLTDAASVDVRPEPNTLLYLGTMTRARRIEFVIETLAKVLETIPDARLIMVGGEPEDIARLQQFAGSLKVSRHVVFTGKLPQADALAQVRSAGVCLSPFLPTPILNSTSPTKLVEYMAVGRPVVANQHPEQSRVIEESGGGLCVPYEPEAFAQAAIRILEDPALAESMGARAREYARRRAYSCIARDVIDEYHRLLEATP